MLRLAIDGQFLFQFGDFRAEDESAAIAHAAQRRDHLILQGSVLAMKVQEGNTLNRSILTQLVVR